eukprot:TRINITY_DN4050_c0_g1_i1.p1 TRINITY_DN4050_c0_g1~~TRINITY_DN4050_c0_g1_i1.p1  ORF type:complete len:117 (+),score=18.43 TRINITY_DN4050_c0_g1_i1:286-636(+)
MIQVLWSCADKTHFNTTKKPRVATAHELYKASTYLEEHFSEVTMPFIVLHGKDDLVTDPEVSKALYDNARSEDKTLKLYEGKWHVLLFEDGHEEVMNDICEWIGEREISYEVGELN